MEITITVSLGLRPLNSGFHSWTEAFSIPVMAVVFGTPSVSHTCAKWTKSQKSQMLGSTRG